MIDLDDVLTDPELGAEALTRVRLDQTVSARGRAVNTETASGFTGIVTQDAGQILERVADGSYVSGSILVTTSTPLRMAGEAVEADLVVWKGTQYNVSKIGDYLAHGYNWAVCNPDGI